MRGQRAGAWFRRAADKIRDCAAEFLGDQLPSPEGDRLYQQMVAAVVEEMRRSLTGVPELMVAHDRYLITLHPQTFARHEPVLGLYKRALREHLHQERLRAARPGQPIYFADEPTLIFETGDFPVDADQIELDQVRVASSFSRAFDAESVSLPGPDAPDVPTPGAATRRLRVQARTGSGHKEALDFSPPRNGGPIAIGRRSDDPRLQAIDSIRVSRDHALLFHDGAHWYIADGALDGAASANGTRIDGGELPPGQRRRLARGMNVGFPDEEAYSWLVLDCGEPGEARQP